MDAECRLTCRAAREAQKCQIERLTAQLDQKDEDAGTLRHFHDKLQIEFTKSQAKIAEATAKAWDLTGDRLSIVRVKHIDPQEQICVTFPSANEIVFPTQAALSNNHTGAKYRFDAVYPPEATINEVYGGCIQDVVRNTLTGGKGAILADGPSGAGKSHTMFNPDTSIMACVAEEFSSWREQTSLRRNVEIKVSAIEVYLSKVNDLLAPLEEPKIAKERSPRRTNNITWRTVKASSDLIDTVQESRKRQRVAKTDNNDTSSRSHYILMIRVDVTNHGNDRSYKLQGKLLLADLAGSEEYPDKLDTERHKESAHLKRDRPALRTLMQKVADGERTPFLGCPPVRISSRIRCLGPRLTCYSGYFCLRSIFKRARNL
jgi:hypothetical protein